MAIAVLPAAGASRRMGRPKLLLPFRGDTVVGSLVRSLREGGISEIVLVTAPGDEALQSWAATAGVRVAVNPAPERGMLSTILEGVATIDESQLLAVCPADLPALLASTVRTVLAAGSHLAVPSYRGRRGHPLVISAELIPEIRTLHLDVGLRELLDRHPEKLRVIEVDDPGAVRDVDTPEEYLALTRSLTEGEPP
ncbi:MAG TPA: nucleotidyltransferase family protein [Thermoanaerobaculia bacterium]|nr:nucleotidyltransferase family protein [Thermoanaerobaculia bacterium]